MQRLLTGLGVSSGVTFALFALMSFLIKSDLEIPTVTDIPPIDINLKIDEKAPDIRDRRIPDKPKPPKTPPLPETKTNTKPDKPMPKNLNFRMAKFEPGVGNNGPYVGQTGGTGGMQDGDAVPMVVIQPNYPRKEAMEGTEGWVKFTFTIAPDGSPKDIQVVDANPKRVFDRAARKAIYKWKFKPRIVDGKAVEQPNMTYTLEFKLSGE